MCNALVTQFGQMLGRLHRAFGIVGHHHQRDAIEREPAEEIEDAAALLFVRRAR